VTFRYREDVRLLADEAMSQGLLGLTGSIEEVLGALR
jgi:hypothetical protein